MNKISSERSIIQSTLFNISISVFFLSIILISLFGQSFWEKESIKLNYGLFNTALIVKERIEGYFDDLYLDVRDIHDYSNSFEVQRINGDIKTLLGNDKSYFVAYYDLKSQWLVLENGTINFSIEDILNALDKSQGIQQINHGNYSLVSSPITHNGVMLGYVWVYAANPEINLITFSKFNIFFILIFAILGTIILLIRKHMKNIQNQLEEFTDSIVHPELIPKRNFNKLPELEPVFDKITGYTQELSAINEELGASQRRFTQIMEGISDGLFSIDREWRLLFYNDVAKKYFDKPDEELKMKNILEIFPSFSNTVTYQYIAEVFLTAEPAYFEADGMMTSERIFHTSIYPFEEGITVFFRDITEQRQQQHEMARLERLNLVGQMAAGISHEIRNPLTTVKGFLQLRGIKVTDPDEKEYNDLMISEIDRANTIISEFLSLAKDNMGSTQEQDINQIIYRIFPMIQADANNGNKDLILNLNPLPSLWLNENEIRQLLLNFVRNALEVTSQGGCVIIRTYEDKNNVVLAVQDQGCGIPEEIRDKIGTPFFTTKESGTGLGIAISMGIAHRHNAELTFDTGDQGTTFKVIFKRRNILGKKDEGELS